MAPEKFHNYPSKIILFGEYLILTGGKAISIPYFPFSIHKTAIAKSNKPFYINLLNFILANPIFENRISPKFKNEIDTGLHYTSTIPTGYGLGSSGALTANIYADYILEKKTQLQELKAELAAIENFFHQQSSGLDPLTSYIQKPILIQGNEIEIDFSIHHLGKFFLYDSGIKRNAKSAIGHFKTLSEDLGFHEELKPLGVINNRIVDAMIAGEDIRKDMRSLSELQYTIFADFIPDTVKPIWRTGLGNDEYYMKLCGAGMGGMFLVYSDAKLDRFQPII
jgi:mevalonate kinase